MDEVEKLEKELEDLKAKRSKEHKIAILKRQIAEEKFNQTKTGKFFNKIGKIFDDPNKKKTGKNNKKLQKPMDVNEIIKKLPQ